MKCLMKGVVLGGDASSDDASREVSSMGGGSSSIGGSSGGIHVSCFIHRFIHRFLLFSFCSSHLRQDHSFRINRVTLTTLP